jgi:predicted RND superfamily exporter protein
MTTIPERPTSEAIRLTDTIERAVKAAGVDDVVTTGFTVLNAREGTRTISSLNGSLALSIVAELAIIAIAFRSIPFGIVAFLPNFLPVVTIGTILFLTHRGMQFSSAIALNVAFGIAVDDTVHFLNRLRLTAGSGSVADRIVDTARRIGPVLIGTTLIIIAGLSTTLTSGLPTVSLFGWIVGITLSVALIGDMVVLPALVAGFARRWFDRRPASGQVEEASA